MKMKTKQFYFGMFVALMATMFTACSSSDEAQNEQGAQLKLSAGITAQKETYNIGEWGAIIDIGDIDASYAKESVYKPKAENTRTPIDDNNWEGMSDRNIAVQIGSNAVSKSTINANGNITMPSTYYFTGMDNVAVKSWYPYSSSLSSFAVRSDQTALANYEKSDLLYASVNVNQSSPNAQLTYSHKTAKIIFYITMKDSKYLYDPTINSVTLSNIYTSGSVSNGAITASGSVGSVKMYNSVATATSSNYVTTATFEACIVPQNRAIKYNIVYGSGTYSGTLASKNILAGKVYTVNVTMTVLPYVDLGLPSGLKWARMNVGARTATEYGDWYMWGNDFGYNDNYHEYYKGTEELTPTGGHDTAHNLWGSPWRTPTMNECQELLSNCTWTSIKNQVNYNGCNGLIFTSKKNGRTMFMPSNGYVYYATNGHSGYTPGAYWTATPIDANHAKWVTWLWGSPSDVHIDNFSKEDGFGIRPVCD
jgi:hypothetical protein